MFKISFALLVSLLFGVVFAEEMNASDGYAYVIVKQVFDGEIVKPAPCPTKGPESSDQDTPKACGQYSGSLEDIQDAIDGVIFTEDFPIMFDDPWTEGESGGITRILLLERGKNIGITLIPEDNNYISITAFGE